MRKSGLAKADKKAAPRRRRGRGRHRALRPTASRAALVEVNCETDFVAREDDFQALRARTSPRLALAARPADVDALLAAQAAVRRDGRGDAPRADRQDRREHQRAPLRARRRRRPRSATYLHGTPHRHAGGASRAATPRSATTSPCTSRRATRSTSSADDVPAEARSRRSASILIAQAAATRRTRASREDIARQDGRGQAAQVAGRDHAARPAVREGRQADRREAARRTPRPRCCASCASRSAPASRRSRKTSSAEVMAQVRGA